MSFWIDVAKHQTILNCFLLVSIEMSYVIEVLSHSSYGLSYIVNACNIITDALTTAGAKECAAL